jgi:hypothetical protein
MLYLDSNVFIYPAIYKGSKANSALRVLEALAEGKLECSTCSLTVDEVLWIVWKKRGVGPALELAERVLRFPNLRVLDVKFSDLDKAIELVRKYEIKPRDAIHAACSLNRGIFTIVSDDADFDCVGELTRLDFETAVRKLKI